MGHFEEKARDQKREPKLKVIEFRGISGKINMSSREQILFHLIFGAFLGTFRIFEMPSLKFVKLSVQAPSNRLYTWPVSTLETEHDSGRIAIIPGLACRILN